MSTPVKVVTDTGTLFGLITSYDMDKESFIVNNITFKGISIVKGDEVLTSGLDGVLLKIFLLGKF